jgi:uncharacterized membrane protein
MYCDNNSIPRVTTRFIGVTMISALISLLGLLSIIVVAKWKKIRKITILGVKIEFFK